MVGRRSDFVCSGGISGCGFGSETKASVYERIIDDSTSIVTYDDVGSIAFIHHDRGRTNLGTYRPSTVVIDVFRTGIYLSNCPCNTFVVETDGSS